MVINLEDAGLNPALFATPAEIGLSERASNACRMLDANSIGDIIQKTEAELLRLPNTGRTTVREIKDALVKFGLRLGTPLPEWNEVDVAAIRTSSRNSIRRAVSQVELGIDAERAATLQDEVRIVLSKVTKERNLALLLSLWGLDGTERKTLEQVGRAYGMTRERVRQIEATNVRKLRARWHDLPLLDASLRALVQDGPARADDVSKLLSKNGVSSSFVSASALLKSAEVFEREADLVVWNSTSASIVGSAEALRTLRNARRELRRVTQSFGCTSLSRIHFQLCGKVEGNDNLRPGLELLDEVVWLDSSRTWLLSKLPVRNRLHNLLEKIFSVTKRIHLSELRQAVSRPHRMKYVPPAEILAAYCALLGLTRTDKNEIVAAELFAMELGDLDGAFVRGFQELNSPLTREDLEDYCVEEEGMKVTSFYQRLTYCPLFLRLAPGVYSLVGAHVPPGSIETAKQRIRQDRISPQHGWTPDGRLWVVLRLSRPSVHSGAFFVPSFVNEHAEGLWNVALPDGTLLLGSAEIKQGIASGMRDVFDLLAADFGDFCLLLFDFNTKVVSVQVGGPDLEDQATGERAADEYDESDEIEVFEDADN